MKTSTAIIVLLISVGLFYTFTSPQYKKIENLRTASKTYNNILNNASELSTKREELLSQYRSIPKENIENLSKVLPDNVDIVRLTMDFDSIASRYGLSIKSIQVDKSKGGTSSNNSAIIVNQAEHAYDSTVISFSFVSSYNNFRKFMRDIESSLRIVNIKSIDFQSTENGLYQYKVSIETYWLK